MVEDDTIKSILEKKTVAVVGLSRDPSKDSYRVAAYLKSNGYKIIPINPAAGEILGEKSYSSLMDVPEKIRKEIEVVDIFRPSGDIQKIVEQAIELKRNGKIYAIWMQLGIVNGRAAELAKNAGLKVVMNRCMKIEHMKLKETAGGKGIP